MCMDENNDVRLPVVFSLDSIPASSDEVCRVEDLSDWPHLQDVIPPEIDAEVGLLIGVKVPAALEPIEIIQSGDGGPFAAKSGQAEQQSSTKRSCLMGRGFWRAYQPVRDRKRQLVPV